MDFLQDWLTWYDALGTPEKVAVISAIIGGIGALFAVTGPLSGWFRGKKADAVATSFVAGDHANITNFQNSSNNAIYHGDVRVQLSKEAEERLLQNLIAKGVPESDRAAELEELKRKYADLEQRLGEYAKTDELAQQARRELDLGNLDQAEALLQQAYDKDYQFSRQRLAQRAFDLAEVAELRLDHDKALARYREVTQLQPDHVTAWWELAKIAKKLGNSTQALDAWRGMQQAAKTQRQDRECAIATVGEADILKVNGDGKTAQEKFLQAHEILKKAAKAEPDNAYRQRDLSVSHEKLGDLYKATGDTPAALKAYQDSLSIVQK
uniref:tetratricopeptide repeat protein n=1 Tax=Thiothrix sp. TaxID=1032 RepID=UPI00257A1298